MSSDSAEKKSPTASDYYQALRQILLNEADVLNRVIPEHPGEFGRNNEAVVQAFLERILPKKYALTTGFVVSSVEDDEPSAQTDLLIYDEFSNSPLFRQTPACVLPIEAVYAAIEVKTTVDKDELNSAVDALARLRDLASSKAYIAWEDTEVNGTIDRRPIPCKSNLPPRCYIFAFKSSWQQRSTCEENFKNAIDESPRARPFVHGLVVLDKHWFVWQEVSGRNTKAEVHSILGDELVHFTRHLLEDLGSFEIGTALTREYLDPKPAEPILGENLAQYRGYVMKIKYSRQSETYKVTIPDLPRIVIHGQSVPDAFSKACQRIDWELSGQKLLGDPNLKPTQKLKVENLRR